LTCIDFQKGDSQDDSQWELVDDNSSVISIPEESTLLPKQDKVKLKEQGNTGMDSDLKKWILSRYENNEVWLQVVMYVIQI
jgi:hypothetical protein